MRSKIQLWPPVLFPGVGGDFKSLYIIYYMLFNFDLSYGVDSWMSVLRHWRAGQGRGASLLTLHLSFHHDLDQ